MKKNILISKINLFIYIHTGFESERNEQQKKNKDFHFHIGISTVNSWWQHQESSGAVKRSFSSQTSCSAD